MLSSSSICTEIVEHFIDKGYDITRAISDISCRYDLRTVAALIARGIDFSKVDLSDPFKFPCRLSPEDILTLDSESDPCYLRDIINSGLDNKPFYDLIMERIFTQKSLNKFSIEVLRLLLENGCKLTEVSILNFYRIPKGFEEGLPITLNSYIRINRRDLYDLTLLLIESYSDMRSITDQILYLVMEVGVEMRLIELLIVGGANAESSTLIEIASELGREDLIRFFYDRGCSLDANSSQSIKLAVRNGHLECVKILEELGVNLRVGSNSLLKLAQVHGHSIIYDYLISMGLEPLSTLQI